MLTQFVVTVWWLGFWTVVGLCVGSFLNVVIFRLPRGRSLRTPLWSACPYCDHRIRWYDNLPVVSFIALRGRCRDCRSPIPTRYLVVEASMAVIALILMDAFLIGDVRGGLSAARTGLTDRLVLDWPIFSAHVVLFACLFCMSAIDLEHYWVDIRFTNLATVAGFVLHALWTPGHSMRWHRPFDATAIVSFLALAGIGLVYLVFVCQQDPQVEETAGDDALADHSAHSLDDEYEPPWPPLEPPSRAPGWIALGVAVVLLVWLLAAELGWVATGRTFRLLIPLALFFCLILRETSVVRHSDHQIASAIEQERFGARQMVLAELSLLLPAGLCAAAGLILMHRSEAFADGVHGALHAGLRLDGWAMMRNWQPLYGLATAATGYVICGALGWAVRIAFTLVFGREAFGTGDIHLLAAAGCIAGWPVVLLAFVLTCGLAVAGWVASLPFKRTRAIPLGPWLSLSILIVVPFYDSMVKWPFIAGTIEACRMVLLRS